MKSSPASVKSKSGTLRQARNNRRHFGGHGPTRTTRVGPNRIYRVRPNSYISLLDSDHGLIEAIDIGAAALSNAVAIFGEDDAPGTRGFIYPNGRFLNLQAGDDHREINSAYAPDEDTGLPDVDLPEGYLEFAVASRNLMAFMAFSGAIRWGTTGGDHLIMSWVKNPTSSQLRAIRLIIEECGIKDVAIDVVSPDYEVTKSVRGSIDDREVQRLIRRR